MDRYSLIGPAPDDFPNHLADPQPRRVSLPAKPWLLLVLCLLCLVPRTVTALRIPCVGADGVIYIRNATALEAGNLRGAMWEGGLNLYPAILTVLHRLGLDWEPAAKLWGVAISCLVLLPLWGWLRRQFDDRIALAACLLYILHPVAISESPEMMRDATFWFFFMLAIYWLWRAEEEVRYRYFIGAGMAIPLAALTRVEGLYLLVPLALWTFWRWLALRTGRRKLIAGAAICVMIFPLLLMLMNVAWLFSHSHWVGMRLPLTRVSTWLASITGQAASGETGLAIHSTMTFGRMVWVFFPTMTRGLTPIFALLMFGGIWGWRRLWSRRDHQALFATAVVVMCGIWIQLWVDQNISPRYATPIVLMASPFAALGLFALAARLVRAAQWLQWREGGQMAVVSCSLAAIAAVNLAMAIPFGKQPFRTRQIEAEIGRLIHEQRRSPAMVVAQAGVATIVMHYSQGKDHLTFRCDQTDEAILGLVSGSHADIVVLKPWRQLTLERCESLVESMASQGMETLDLDRLSIAKSDYFVMARSDRPRTGPEPAEKH